MIAATVRGATERGQRPTFATRVESVRVDALVTENGQPVPGLGATDFEVFDNGVRQEVDLVSFEQVPLDVVLALDMSDSVAGERLDHLRSAGDAVLEGLTGEDRAALVTFNHAVSLGTPLTKDVATVRSALDVAGGTGETALVDGAYAAMILGESDTRRALQLIFSDGLDTASWLTSAAVLDVAKRAHIVVYAVTTAAGASPFLRDLSAFTGGSVIQIVSSGDLRSTFLRILDEFRHRYLVSYSPRGVETNGWHRLEVRVRNRHAIVKARPGYLAGS
jgi:Ca-activated chloride channel homolog